MWTESRDERGQETGDGSSASAPTFDPNATLPQPTFETRGAPKDGAPPAGGAVGEGGSAEPALWRYRILGPLGEGGMGVVYRAEDTRLGRSVAIKTVPAARTAEPRAKERFLAEARAASALDHPNICTVYEIEESPSGQLYLTMPCYDGETLRGRLQRGPLPPALAVELARQVARGLAKAHQLGIVHCDVKPANLMLTGDGIVKILDFGIARLSGQPGLAAPTPAARAGPYGTPRYRSPEQARGEEVGAATDIWSLGVVLCEMLAGRPEKRGAPGETAAPTPSPAGPPLRHLPKQLPPQLRDLLARMLAERASDRYPDAAALLVDLDRLAEQMSGRGSRSSAASPRRRLLTAVATAAGLAVAGGTLFVARGGPFAMGRPSSRGSAGPTLDQVTDFPGRTTYPALSPDGDTVVYVRSVGGRSRLFAQPPSRGADAIDLSTDSPADDTQPSFSADGRRIAFRSERDGGGIFVMPARGGAARRVADFGFHPAWSPDGRQIAVSTASIAGPQIRRSASAVFVVDLASGARVRVSRGDAAQPSWSPHGWRIAYWGLVPETGRRTLWTVPVEAGAAGASISASPATPAIDDGHLNWSPVWGPDGRWLYFASDRSGVMNLWRVAIDERSGRVRREPEPVTASQQPCVLPSLSRDGRRLVYASDGSTSTLERVGFNPLTGTVSGAATTIVQTSGVIIAFDASLDGRWLVYQLLTPREELAVVHPDGSGSRRLLGDDFKNRLPQLEADGSRVLFYSNRGGKYEVWSIGVDGRGLRPETRLPGRFVSTPLRSPEGGVIACQVGGREALVDLARPLAERVPRLLPSPGAGAAFVAYSWSADGRWLAGALQRPGAPPDNGIVLYSLVDGRYTHLTSHGSGPVWLHDSRRMLYSDGDSVRLLDTRSGRSLPVVSPPDGSTFRDVNASPDGRTLYLARTLHEGQIWLLGLR